MKFIAAFIVIFAVSVCFILWLGYSSSEQQPTGLIAEAKKADTEDRTALKGTFGRGVTRLASLFRKYRDDVSALSVMVTGVFTVIVGGATVFLYLATRDFVKDAKQTSER